MRNNNKIPYPFSKIENKDNKNSDFYITSTNLNLNKKNDNIWLLIMFLILLDII